MENNTDQKINACLSEGRLPFKRTRDEAWKATEARINDGRILSMRPTPATAWFRYAAAIALLAVGAFAGVYIFGKTTVTNAADGIYSARLPDGSKVTLNSGAEITFNTFTFPLRRKVHAAGETFFQVTRGSAFTVTTVAGDVRVLGTSFNVHNIGKELRVACKTGRVAVDVPSGKSFELTPGMSVFVKNGNAAMNEVQTSEIGAWSFPVYSFNDVPVKDVFKTLSENMDFDISCDFETSARYSGEFSGAQRTEDLLDIVCKPLGFRYRIDEQKKLITILNK